jgi:DNA polymerase bacteriophage-type
MPTGHMDAELRSRIALDVAGVSRYARDPSTEVLCVAWAVDDGAPNIWRQGDPPPEELLACDEIVAHNFAFERAIATHILTPRHRWPGVPLAKQRCSMSLALSHALPAALDKLTKALGLAHTKDIEGYRLMRRMSRPRKPRKGEDPNGI